MNKMAPSSCLWDLWMTYRNFPMKASVVYPYSLFQNMIMQTGNMLSDQFFRKICQTDVKFLVHIDIGWLNADQGENHPSEAATAKSRPFFAPFLKGWSEVSLLPFPPVEFFCWKCFKVKEKWPDKLLMPRNVTKKCPMTLYQQVFLFDFGPFYKADQVPREVHSNMFWDNFFMRCVLDWIIICPCSLPINISPVGGWICPLDHHLHGHGLHNY